MPHTTIVPQKFQQYTLTPEPQNNTVYCIVTLLYNVILYYTYKMPCYTILYHIILFYAMLYYIIHKVAAIHLRHVLALRSSLLSCSEAVGSLPRRRPELRYVHTHTHIYRHVQAFRFWGIFRYRYTTDYRGILS